MANLDLQIISSGDSLDDEIMNNNINVLNAVPLTGTTLNDIPTFSPDACISAESINNVFTKIKENWIDTSDGTADTGDILDGKLAYVNGKSVMGTMPIQTASSITASGATVSVPAGYYASQASKSVATATQATPSISINSSGLITASSTQSAGYVSSGTKSSTKQLTTQAAKTVTPSTSAQTAVSSGVYTTGAVTVAAMPTATQATPSISVNSSGLITASATQSAGYVTAGTKSTTKQLTTQAATTITPSTYRQTAVPAGYYTTGAVFVNPVPTQTKSATPSKSQQTVTPDSGKFLSSVTIGAIPRGYITTSDATATESYIASGKTAYVKGSKVTGTIPEYTVNHITLISPYSYVQVADQFSTTYYIAEDGLFRKNTKLESSMPLSEFGDATAAEVAAGKTFTSASGLKIPGTGGNYKYMKVNESDVTGTRDGNDIELVLPIPDTSTLKILSIGKMDIGTKTDGVISSKYYRFSGTVYVDDDGAVEGSLVRHCYNDDTGCSDFVIDTVQIGSTNGYLTVTITEEDIIGTMKSTAVYFNDFVGHIIYS